MPSAQPLRPGAFTQHSIFEVFGWERRATFRTREEEEVEEEAEEEEEEGAASVYGYTGTLRAYRQAPAVTSTAVTPASPAI